MAVDGEAGAEGRVVITEREVLDRRGYDLKRERLGEGRYSKVRSAVRRPDGAGVAVKIVDLGKLSENFWRRWGRRELEVMGAVSHGGLLRLLDWWGVGRKVFMVLELGRGGDLLRLVQREGALSQPAVRSSASQLGGALAYLHRRRFAHRDLKLENILVMEPVEKQLPVLKIGDFTFARSVPEGQDTCTTYCGSKAYSCPELLAAQPYCPFRADVWALGVVLYIAALGRMPFNERVEGGRAAVLEQQRPGPYRRLLRDSRLPGQLQDLISQALTMDQAVRPSAAALLRQPFLAGPADVPQPQPLLPNALEPNLLPPPIPSATNNYD